MSAQDAGGTGYGGDGGYGGGGYGYAIPEPSAGQQQYGRGGRGGTGMPRGNDGNGGQQRVSRNFAYPLRPVLQARSQPQQEQRQDQQAGDGYSYGSGGGNSARRAPLPPLHQQRQQQQPMPQDRDRIYISRNPKSAPTPQRQYETNPSQPAAVAYRSPSIEQQQSAQPRYSNDRQQRRQGERETTSGIHPSMQSDRPMGIGFNPQYDYGIDTGGNGNSNSFGVVPRFPAPTSNQQQQRQQKQRSSANTALQPRQQPPQASARRTATSSFYSQQGIMQVSPIPEESNLSQPDSYVSSATIPSGWDPDEGNPFSNDDRPNHPENTLPIQHGAQDNEQSLVRQASLGKRHKPTMTEIKSPERSRSRTGTTSAVIAADAGSATRKISPPLTTMSSGSGTVPKVSPASVTTPSPLSQTPLAADSEYFPPTHSPPETTRPRSTAESKELGLPAFSPPPSIPPAVARRVSQLGPSGSRVPGKRVPPRLNIDAVRDAEARGSLTSLADLIRRATKLAAVLETGRPGSTAWGGRDRSRGRDTDSISDILASFPAPALGGAQSFPQRMSQWPSLGADGCDDNGSLRPVKSDRRICGLPPWAFIIFVILGLVIVTAAVVIPLQLVNLSKSQSDNDASILARCKKSDPCQNGGENVGISGFCSCICTNGFTGVSCETKGGDSSCTTYDFANQGDVKGIKNATIGSALPRLFTKSQSYNITLDPSLILGVFSRRNLSCTLQNALVNFNGRTEPTPTSKRRRQHILTDTALHVVPTPTGAPVSAASASAAAAREIPLVQDVVDFARVGVLYLAQTKDIATAESAHEALDGVFGRGQDFGNVTSGNITFRLDNRRILLDDGSVVGRV